jgi:hypothetical protein
MRPELEEHLCVRCGADAPDVAELDDGTVCLGCLTIAEEEMLFIAGGRHRHLVSTTDAPATRPFLGGAEGDLHGRTYPRSVDWTLSPSGSMDGPSALSPSREEYRGNE